MPKQKSRVSEGNAVLRLLKQKIEILNNIANELPGVVVVHDLKTATVEYMSERGLNQLGVTIAELKEMGTEYYQRYFNPDDAREYTPKILGLLQRNNDDETISFFQQVRFSPGAEYIWHMTSIKIFLRDEAGQPTHTILVSCPIDPDHHFSTKISRLLEYNNFLRKNIEHFARLGKREKEVLKGMALGKSSSEIAKELFISVATVDTHRKNIKQKLNTNSSYELAKYAKAFELIQDY